MSGLRIFTASCCLLILVGLGGCSFLKHPLLVGPIRPDQVKVVLTPGHKAVFEKDKQIFYFDGKTQVQLTLAGSNHDPVLSPDDSRALFTRKSKKEAMIPVDGGDGFYDPEDAYSDQLWVIDIASRTERLLVDDLPWPGDFPHEEGVRLDPWIGNPQFAVDGKSIYFTVPVWVTSSALYVVSADGGEAKFITSANYLKVIERGEYKGNLILSKHRYFRYGGSYDWCYIFSPDGKEIEVLSDDPDAIDWERLYFEETPDEDLTHLGSLITGPVVLGSARRLAASCD